MNSSTRSIPLLAVVLIASSPAALRGQAWALDPTVAPSIVNDVPMLVGTTFVPTPSGQFLAYGDFTQVNGTAAPGLVRLGADGRPDPVFVAELAADERITGVAPLPDGRAVVLLGPNPAIALALPPVQPPVPGGAGTSVDPTGGVAVGGGGSTGGVVSVSPVAPTVRLIRLRADGRRDTAFTAIAIDNYPRLLPLSDGGVLVWGSFRTVGGQARNSLARLNPDGTLDLTFAPALTSAALTVNAAAAASDGGLVLSAVAYNSERGGTTVYLLTRLLANGAVDKRFSPDAVNTVYSLLAVQTDGSVMAGNSFINYPVSARPDGPGVVLPPDGMAPVNAGGLVRYTPAGVVDRTYSAQIPGLQSIAAIASLPNGRLAVGATVGTARGLGAPAVFTLSSGGQLERDFRKLAGAGEGQRLVTALPDGRVLLLQGTLVLSSSYYPVPFDPASPAATPAIMPIFLGPTMVEPELAVSFVDASAVVPLTTSIVHRYAGTVRRLEADSAGRVLAAGSFTQVEGAPRAGLVRFLANGALDRSFAPAGGELLFTPPDGRAIVRRTVLGPAEKDGFHHVITQVARLLDDGAIDTGFAFPAALDAAQVNWLLAAPDGRLLVAAFEPDDSREQNLKLVWLGADGRRVATLPTVFTEFTRYIVMPLDAAGAPVSSDIVLGYPIFYGRPNVIDAAQLLSSGQLLVAGAFARVNGAARPGLVRLLAEGKEDATYVPAVDGRRYASTSLPLPDGRALVFGHTFEGGRWHSGVRRLLANGLVDPTFRPTPDTIASGARLLVDGSFFSNGCRFLADGWPDLNFAPALRLDADVGYAGVAVLAPGGKLWVGGTFTTAEGQPRISLARFVPVEIVAITVGPRSQTIVAGRDAYFQVAIGTAQPAAYRWTRDGVTVAGETGATLRLAGVRVEQAGTNRAVVTVAGRTLTSDPAVLTVTPNKTRLINFSARSRVAAGGAPQIAGLVATASTPRTVLFRAVGNGLPANPGTAALPVPVLTLYDETRMIAQDRGGALSPTVTAMARSVGAFPLSTSPVAPSGIYGSAVMATLGAGTYMAMTTSGDNSSGLSLFEFYDSGGESSAPLVRNISLRGQTGPGALVLTAGFVLQGNGPLQLLLRGLGPALLPFGVADAAPDPRLALYAAGLGSPLVENDDWVATPDLVDAARRAGAFVLPAGSRDAVILITLEPGAYSVQLAAAGNTTGTGLIEIYTL